MKWIYNVKIPNKFSFNNSNAKITQDYLKKLDLIIAKNPTFTISEINKQITEETKIKFTNSGLGKVLKRNGFTKKNVTFFYDSSFTEINVKRTENFKKSHDSKISRNYILHYHSFLLSSSTDESGFDNLGSRKKGSKLKKSQKK